RTPGSNPYMTYRFLRDDISLSKNLQALSLYSESIGAILETSNELNW
ncbi:11935_t:CDS:1, partial [Gigaspora rosea]